MGVGKLYVGSFNCEIFVGISIFVIFIIVLLMMGLDILSALNVVFTISLIVLNMFGVMYLWSIPLNAVSLVNLVMVSSSALYTTCFFLDELILRGRRGLNERLLAYNE